jgi:hypothetical protein
MNTLNFLDAKCGAGPAVGVDIFTPKGRGAGLRSRQKRNSFSADSRSLPYFGFSHQQQDGKRREKNVGGSGSMGQGLR